jgi:hypothetical protein
MNIYKFAVEFNRYSVHYWRIWVPSRGCNGSQTISLSNYRYAAVDSNCRWKYPLMQDDRWLVDYLKNCVGSITSWVTIEQCGTWRFRRHRICNVYSTLYNLMLNLKILWNPRSPSLQMGNPECIESSECRITGEYILNQPCSDVSSHHVTLLSIYAVFVLGWSDEDERLEPSYCFAATPDTLVQPRQCIARRSSFARPDGQHQQHDANFNSESCEATNIATLPTHFLYMNYMRPVA